MRKLISLFFLLICFSSQAMDYVVVGVSGFGTRRPENAWQPSAAHELLPVRGNIYSRHELVHYANNKELNNVLEEFDCRKGKQQKDQLGLIILVNSWGSSKGHKLAKMYESKCGRLADAFYIIDGVRKPIGAFSTNIKAQSCHNIYQRKGAIRGKAIKGCTNTDLTEDCDAFEYGGVECHIHAEWKGGQRFADHMLRNYLLD